MADDAANPHQEEQQLTKSTTRDSAESEAATSNGTADAAGAMSAAPVERWPLVAGLIGVSLLSALVGWLGLRAYEAHTAEVQRGVFLQVARQGAVNLTTYDYQHVDADVQRILNSGTGTFYDNFSRRSRAFVDSVKQGRSTSVGTVTEAGVESQTGDEGHVLVAVNVKTTGPGSADQEPQAWRMRITVRKVGDWARVSNVAFVS